MRPGFRGTAADYYGVSCDYLLGRTADKTGAVIAVDEIPENDPAARDNQFRGSVLPVLNKKLLVQLAHILFDLLQKCNNKALTTEVSSYLMAGALRGASSNIFHANPRTPPLCFRWRNFVSPLPAGESGKATARIGRLTQGFTVGGEPGRGSGQAARHTARRYLRPVPALRLVPIQPAAQRGNPG